MPFFGERRAQPGCMNLPALPSGGAGGSGERGEGQSVPSRCKAENPETAQIFRSTNYGTSLSWDITRQLRRNNTDSHSNNTDESLK